MNDIKIECEFKKETLYEASYTVMVVIDQRPQDSKYTSYIYMLIIFRYFCIILQMAKKKKKKNVKIANSTNIKSGQFFVYAFCLTFLLKSANLQI